MLDLPQEVLGRAPVDDLPPGRMVELPGRGTTFVADMPGPPGAPTLFLLHGLAATGYLHWRACFPALRGRYRVLLMDMRGHGRGIHLGGRFRLADCADDVAAVADVLRIERIVPVGYSLGGPVAQLVWHRHHDRVAGLVLCATARNFGGTAQERVFYRLVTGAVTGLRLVTGGGPSAREAAAGPFPETFRDEMMTGWALRELRQCSAEALFGALDALGRFSSHSWVERIDVPTAVVVTTKDRAISAARQLKLARAIPGATIHPVNTGHVGGTLGGRLIPVLLEACASVASRIREPSDDEHDAGRRIS